MTLGQRLPWHLNLVDQTINVSQLPNTSECYLRAINARYKSENKSSSGKEEGKKKSNDDDGYLKNKPEKSLTGAYSKESNTVFYYNEYKVLLLLDFSKSTTTIYPYQNKTYIDKMKDSIEIFITNLLFRLENKFQDFDDSLNEDMNTQRSRKASQQEDSLNPLTKMSYLHHKLITEEEEDPEDFSQSSGRRNTDSHNQRPGMTPKLSPQVNRKNSSNRAQPYYEPHIYLSIVASGLPPNNQMKLLIHNQKMDDLNSNEVLRSLDQRLQVIEDQLAENYSQGTDQEDFENQEEYLQRHLFNANCILSLMKPQAKPLLVLMTDSSSSLLSRSASGKMDPMIQKLHQSDTKIITVDLGDENKVANTFGYINHEEHLKYLAYVTCGAHFDYSTLVKLAGVLNQSYLGLRPRIMSNSFYNKGNRSHLKLSKFSMGKASKFSTDAAQSLTSRHNIQGSSSQGQPYINLSAFNQKVGMQAELAEMDKDHPFLNSLQKLMFSRPCSYSRFLQTSEIQELINYQERLIFENRISSDLVKKLRKDKDLFVNSSFSAKELIMNNRYVPIFRKEQLAEYAIKCNNIWPLTQFRSKVCFQYVRSSLKPIKQQAVTSETPQKRRKASHLSQTSEYQKLPQIRKIYYQFWWSNQILLLCSLSQQVDKRFIHVKYKVVAQEEVIDQLKRDKKYKKTIGNKHQFMNLQMGQMIEQTSLIDQMSKFLENMMKQDKMLEVFERIGHDIERGWDYLQKKQDIKNKYKQIKVGINLSKKNFPSKQESEVTILHQDQIDADSQKSKFNLRRSANKTSQGEKSSRSGSKRNLDGSTSNRNRSSKTRRLAKTQSNVIEEPNFKFAMQDISSEDDFKQLLLQHRKTWLKLLKIPLSSWPQLLNYQKLDLLTHSNFKFLEMSELSQQIDAAYNLDFQISRNVYEQIKQFTTFSLDKDTFVQVFKESKQGSSQFTKHDSHENLYGFCLIKTEWVAANIAVVHFGFYHVFPNQISHFITHFKNLNKVNSYSNFQNLCDNLADESDKQSYKYLYQLQSNLRQKFTALEFLDKNISSLLINNNDECPHKTDLDANQSMREAVTRSSLNEDSDLKDIQPNQAKHSKMMNASKSDAYYPRARSKDNNYKNLLSELEFEEILQMSQKSQKRRTFKSTFDKQRSLFYHKNWVWKNENKNTNQDFFEIVMKQRIKEGFYFVNRGCENDEYLFIKILPAFKHKLTRKSNKPNKVDDFGLCQDSKTSEQTFILVQYLMYLNKDQEQDDNSVKSYFKTELYMEQETVYFYFQRNLNQNESVVGSTSGRGQSDWNPMISLQDELNATDYNKILDSYNCLSDKNFFHELYEYIQSVDQFLFNNICTYHNIVKNSVLKLINSPENPLIKGEVCYFKNLNVHKVKQRKRMKLELAIRHKMQLLKRDWREFIKIEYPELFLNEAEYGEESQDAKTSLVENNQNQEQTRSRRNSQAIHERVMEAESFILQIEELLENSKLIKTETFEVPQFIFDKRSENLKEVLSKFYDQNLKIFEEFCDFKIFNYQNDKINEKFHETNPILDQASNQGSMEVEYYRLNKKMIKISKKLMKNRILHFLNPDFQQEQQFTELEKRLQHQKILNSQHQVDRNSMRQKDQDQEEHSQIQNQESMPPIIISTYDDEDDDDDENINQIDQICDFIFYYESSIRNNNTQLQFEPNVRTIINNFCTYLRTNYETIYAETVLMSLQDELEKQKFLEDSEKLEKARKKCLAKLKNDFQNIKSTLTECRFRMDISFLILLIYSLKKQGRYPEGDSYKQFREALDQIFNDLICRNFEKFEADSEFYIFKHSQNDKTLVRELGTPIKGENLFIHTNNLIKDSSNYLVDLAGTKDSYSDSEEASESIRKPKKETQEFIGAEQIYNSCKKLLFKVNIVIRDSQGNKIVDRQVSKISEVFDLYSAEVEQVSKDLVEKVKFMEEERQIAQKNNDVILNGIRMMEQLRESQYGLLELNQDDDKQEVDMRDIQSSVEIYFSFYTIPQYVGLVRDQDVDFICDEKDEILVNDDDHEDLKRITKLMDYLGYGNNTEKRIENEDIRFKELLRPFNKKQLIKSIPYYFKITDQQQELQQKDYKIYYYDEIQRKIIYGILRRTYALMAQDLLEHATLIRPIDQLNVALVQKYMGALLYNQKQQMKINIISNVGSKLKYAHQILQQDLKRSKILNVSHIIDKDQEMYFVKTSARLRNFLRKNDVQDFEGKKTLNADESPLKNMNQSITEGDITESAISPANETKDFNNEFFQFMNEKKLISMNDQSLNFEHCTLNELDQEEQIENSIDSEDFEIPFWILFKIEEIQSNGGELNINFAYHLPLYKCHSQLNFISVENELTRCMEVISKRLKTMLIMQRVDETRVWSNNLFLNDCSGGQQSSKQNPNTFSQLTSALTQNRMEQAKNILVDMSRNDSVAKPSPFLKNTTPVTTEKQQQPKGQISSRFRMRMDKINKQTKKEPDQNQTDSATPVQEQTPIQEPVQLGIPETPQQVAAVEYLYLNKVFQHSFPLNHSSIRIEDAIQAISEKTFIHFQLTTHNNLFVTRRDTNIYIIRIQGRNQDQNLLTKSHNQLSAIRSQSNLHQSQLDSQTQAEDQTQNNKNKTPLSSIFNVNTTLMTKQSVHQPHNTIIMEVFGTNAPPRKHIEPLIQSIQMVLMKETIEKIGQNSLRHVGQISKDDYNYIKGSDQKMLLAFPVADQITDKYALLKYLHQNLTRYLVQVKFKQEHQVGHAVSGFQQTHFQNQSTNKFESNLQVNETMRQKLSISSNEELKNQHQDHAYFRTERTETYNQSNSLVGQNFLKSNFEEMYEQESFARRDSDSSEDVASSIINIPFKPENFLLLYNYQMQLGQNKNEKKAKNFTIENIFGQALSLLNISVLNQFNYENLDSKQLGQNHKPIHLVKSLHKDFLKMFPSQILSQKNADSSEIYGLYGSFLPADEEQKFKPQMPLIFRTFKQTTSDERNQKKEKAIYELINQELGIPTPNNRNPNQKWLYIKMNVLGQLKNELFLQNIILNVNQAFNETMIELYIKRALKTQPGLLIDSEIKNQQQVSEIRSIGKIEKKKEEKVNKQRSNYSKKLDVLESLLSQGSLTLSNMIIEVQKLIYGDPSELVYSLMFSFIRHFHDEFRSILRKNKSKVFTIENEYGIVLLIELFNKSTNELVKTVILNLSEDLNFTQYELVFNEMKRHLNKTQTILRNIHPQFKLLIGSFSPEQSVLVEEGNQRLFYKSFKSQIFQFQGLMPDEDDAVKINDKIMMDKKESKNEVLFDNLNSLKVYPDCNSTVQVDEKQKFFLNVQHSRNFFILISLKEEKLQIKSYNLDKKTQKICKNMILNQLVWQSNRQEQFKRILSQKLGTVYTLKDFYTSQSLITDQNFKNLTSQSTFTYEKTAQIIEGKQLYNFKMSNVKRRQKSKTKQRQRQNQQNIVKVDTEIENQAEEYLKTFSANDNILKELYKKVNFKEDSVQKQDQQIIQEQQINKSNRKTRQINPMLSMKLRGNKSIQKLNEKVFQEDENIKDDQALKKNQKPIVQFKDFIRNKSMLGDYVKQDNSLELKITSLFVISPSLTPNRIDRILCEKEKTSYILAKQYYTHNASSKNSFDDQTCSSDLNDKILLTNPLYFHGTKIYRMMAGFFTRIQQARLTAMVYRDWESKISDPQTQDQTSSKHKKMNFKEIVERFFKQKDPRKENKYGLQQAQNQSISVPSRYISYLITQSRLLYSSTTRLLFDLNPISALILQNFDDFDYTITMNKNDKKAESEYKKDRMKHMSKKELSQTEILDVNNKQLSKNQLDEFRKDFFKSYIEFLRSKAGVTNVTDAEADHNHQDNMLINRLNNKHKRIISQIMNSSSTQSLNRRGLMNQQEDRKGKIQRSKKLSDDYSSFNSGMGGIPKSKIIEEQSNSSLVNSQGNKEDSQINFFIKKNKYQERFLFAQQMMNFDSNNNNGEPEIFQYIVKVVDEALFIYRLSFKNGLIKINVYEFDEILASFPKQILLNWQSYFRMNDNLKEKRKFQVNEEFTLSTKLNTDSFNYDFHSKNIYNKIKFPERGFSVDQQIHNLLTFYKTPPKYSRNYVDCVVLRIDLGFLNKASDLEFFQYFLTKMDAYDFKISSLKNTSNRIAVQLQSSPRLGSPAMNSESNAEIFGFFIQRTDSGQSAKNVQSLQQQQIQQWKINNEKKAALNQQKSMTKQPSNTALMNQAKEDSEEDQNQKGKSKPRLQKEQSILKNVAGSKTDQKQRQQIAGQKLQWQQQLVTNFDQQSQLSYNKLFYVQLRDPLIHEEIGSQAEVYRKVWNLKCKKQEKSDNQINMDNADGEGGMGTQQSTIMELVFYYICIEDSKESVDSYSQTNQDKYPLMMVSNDMESFIIKLQQALNQCRKDLIKDQLWAKFFDQTNELQLTDIQIDDMIRFSNSYDLRSFDERYKELFSLKKYTKSNYHLLISVGFVDFLKQMYHRPKQTECYFFNRNFQYQLGGMNERENMFMNMLIFEPTCKNFMIHLEFNLQTKNVQPYLVRKEESKQSNQRSKYEDQHTLKSKQVCQLDEKEKAVVKKLVNLFIFWLYKRSV